MKSLCIALLFLGACADTNLDNAIEIEWTLPAHFPLPLVPSDNPLRTESIELGRHLFYDTRLSGNESISCSTCHQQEFAFADTLALSLGATGQLGTLNAPSLSNAIYTRPLTWAHGGVTRIEEQLIGPMFGESPIEMGITGAEALVLDRIRSESQYATLFENAFPGQPVDFERIRYALASFVRSLLSYRSPFDGFIAGDKSAISSNALAGSELFYSSRLGCSACHSGFAFTSAALSQNSSDNQSSPYHNIGLYNLNGRGDYPEGALGRIEESGIPRDMGRFRVPSLRNIALTAPYGHDGSVATLEEFIRIYEAGGRNTTTGPLAGDGRQSPWRSEQLKHFELSDKERSDLIEFLESLSDIEMTNDPAHSNPW